MRPIRFSAVLLLGAAFCPVPYTRADEAPANKLSPAQLRLEVMALRTLHQFQFDADQRAALGKLAPKSPAPVQEKNKLPDAILKKLADLRGALLMGAADRISEIEESLDSLLEKEKRGWEVDVPIGPAARQQVPDLRRLLSARQVVAFLALYQDDVPDPLSELLQALEEAPRINKEEWKGFCANTGEVVGRLAAGLEPDRIQKISTRVSQWLNQVRNLGAKEIDRRRPELQKEARQLLSGVDPVDVLGNVVDHALAELLANPRLPAALDALVRKQ